MMKRIESIQPRQGEKIKPNQIVETRRYGSGREN